MSEIETQIVDSVFDPTTFRHQDFWVSGFELELRERTSKESLHLQPKFQGESYLHLVPLHRHKKGCNQNQAPDVRERVRYFITRSHVIRPSRACKPITSSMLGTSRAVWCGRLSLNFWGWNFTDGSSPKFCVEKIMSGCHLMPLCSPISKTKLPSQESHRVEHLLKISDCAT